MSAQQEPGTFLYWEVNFNHENRTVWITREWLIPAHAERYKAFQVYTNAVKEVERWTTKGYANVGKEQAE